MEFGDETSDRLCVLSGAPSFRDVADISMCFHGDRIQDMEMANARLISAAPELLAALLAITDMAERCDSWESFPSEPIEIARAAIYKATGE